MAIVDLETASSSTYRVVDLFAGCGGLSRGLARTGRFHSEFAVEIEPHAARTFRTNVRNADGLSCPTFIGDIRDLVNDRNRMWKELRAAGIAGPGDIDLLAGGPPCQGFSRNGVRKYIDHDRKVRFYDEPRNHLFRAFLTFVEELSPRVVLIENVREFLNAKNGQFLEELTERLNELGYNVVARKLCAADYGVPQIRNRAIVLAGRDGLWPSFPDATHQVAADDGQKGLLTPYTTVRDAIWDLPVPTFSQKDAPLKYLSSAGSELASKLRSSSGMVPNHVARVLSKLSLERVRAVGSGRMRDLKDGSLKTKKFYGGAYGRLKWDEPALTITTWVYHVGSGRFAHPTEDRAITMREAARLQTFDDDFVFPPLINPVSQMIGNAVPPLLAESLGLAIARTLDRSQLAGSPVDKAS